MRSIYFSNRFFWTITFVILSFLLSISFPSLLLLAQVLLISFIFAVIVDFCLLFWKSHTVLARRICRKKFSNGDKNLVRIHIENHYPFTLFLKVIDELPFIFQIRDNYWEMKIPAMEDDNLEYHLQPKKRGVYSFGAINLYAQSFIKLISRRFRFEEKKDVAVYPAFIEMKKYELIAFSNRLSLHGNKRQRKLGQTMEFEQIKSYIPGDDPRLINWKASARKNELMVNQYQDERAQNVYCIIDKGRLMKMPFDGMSLLDYAINASLVIANISLKKADRAGLITFGHKMSTVLEASNRKGQMQKIFEMLYGQKSHYLESNFALLHSYISRKILQRSLLIMFTNFESLVSFKRNLPFLKFIAKRHLLLIVFFRNSGLTSMIAKKPKSVKEIYNQTIASQFINDKRQIVSLLKHHGILSIWAHPKDITISTLNKYIEIKKRRMI